MYADDHDSNLPGNFGAWDQAITWVAGWLDFISDNTDNTNLLFLLNGKLWPYCQSYGVYKCPADKSTARIRGKLHPRVRSVSMNGWIGFTWPNPANTNFHVFNRLVQISNPSSIWVLVDEREDSIDDSYCGVEMTRSAFGAWPASYHNGACGFAFADGHAEIKSWKDPRTKPPIRRGVLPPSGVVQAGNLDIKWLQERTTVRK
jgi:prepilin-type processing-associated H-X9-DG protein